jgi:hypothetical protein
MAPLKRKKEQRALLSSAHRRRAIPARSLGITVPAAFACKNRIHIQRRSGRIPLYTPEALDEYAIRRIGPARRSTSHVASSEARRVRFRTSETSCSRRGVATSSPRRLGRLIDHGLSEFGPTSRRVASTAPPLRCTCDSLQCWPSPNRSQAGDSRISGVAACTRFQK